MAIVSSSVLKKMAYSGAFVILNLSCMNSSNQSEKANISSLAPNVQVPASPTPFVGNASPCEEFDENDDTQPLSIRSLKNDFKHADIVVYAEVLTMKPDKQETGYRPYTYTAKVKEVFKGGFKPDETIEYGDTIEVYDEEPAESQFLGDRILWLHRWHDNGKLRYGQIEFMWGGIDCNIVEKLRRISKLRH